MSVRPARFEAAWARSDELFTLVAREALLDQPIALRQPFLFYLGHLPAFAWNHLGRGVLGRPSFEADLDDLFARGIDPVDVDEYRPAEPHLWPTVERAIEYRDRVRDLLRSSWEAVVAAESGPATMLMVLEHELMHHETLLYMVQQLPADRKRPPVASAAPPRSSAAAGRIVVPGGRALLGAQPGSLLFAWDNELPGLEVEVPPFAIDSLPVRNAEFLEFVESGGYAERRWWDEVSWAWRVRRALARPVDWHRVDGRWRLRTVFGEVPLEEAARWPVAVSWAEANAFARWRGARLPTEAEFHRAAYGDVDGGARSFPWGEDAPGREHGNFDRAHWTPVEAGAYPAGASAWGVQEMVGNGWEWTSSAFAPFPGFVPLARYPEYSQDFFDERHYVLRGASWATDAGLVRRSFRNWFQPHYPYVFSKFRLVWPEGS